MDTMLDNIPLLCAFKTLGASFFTFPDCERENKNNFTVVTDDDKINKEYFITDFHYQDKKCSLFLDDERNVLVTSEDQLVLEFLLTDEEQQSRKNSLVAEQVAQKIIAKFFETVVNFDEECLRKKNREKELERTVEKINQQLVTIKESHNSRSNINFAPELNHLVASFDVSLLSAEEAEELVKELTQVVKKLQ